MLCLILVLFEIDVYLELDFPCFEENNVCPIRYWLPIQLIGTHLAAVGIKPDNYLNLYFEHAEAIYLQKSVFMCVILITHTTIY